MTALRPRPLVPPRFAVAMLATVLAPAACLAVESGEQPAAAASREQAPTTRRSHIQPVGEVAEASRNADALGMRLSRASEVLRRQLGLARGAGLVVEEVFSGSPAEKAGFRQHDVLVLLDDQMLLLPEQLAALLEASSGGASPQCTLLRGGANVTISLGGPGREAASARIPTTTAVVPAAAAPPAPARASTAATRQTAAKPSSTPGLRAPASTLALVQPGQAAPRTDKPSVRITPGSPAEQPSARGTAAAEEVLLREDDDYRIRLSRGRETRLIVVDPEGRIVFNDEIDTPAHRGLVPAAVRRRVEEMEQSLEAVAHPPALEIGRLDVAPVEIR